mmetsp:Transcript_20462/g.48012  ORF Transcript_20462/g.48012 Transcript_20462/m.48012 type:complete len:214 (+) Transcript_20462:148-789(+)
MQSNAMQCNSLRCVPRMILFCSVLFYSVQFSFVHSVIHVFVHQFIDLFAVFFGSGCSSKKNPKMIAHCHCQCHRHFYRQYKYEYEYEYEFHHHHRHHSRHHHSRHHHSRLTNHWLFVRPRAAGSPPGAAACRTTGRPDSRRSSWRPRRPQRWRGSSPPAPCATPGRPRWFRTGSTPPGTRPGSRAPILARFPRPCRTCCGPSGGGSDRVRGCQ